MKKWQWERLHMLKMDNFATFLGEKGVSEKNFDTALLHPPQVEMADE